MADTDIYDKMDSMLKARSYIKRRLGEPVICVEVADIQLNDIIIDSVAEASRYLYGEATFRDYVAFQITKGQENYVLEDSISDVIAFDFTSILDGINVLHSPTHMLLYNDWVAKGAYPGGSSQQSSLVSYDIAMMYLKEVQNQFGVSYQADYNDSTNTLKLVPTPKDTGVGLLKVWRKNQITEMMDHPLVKELMVSRAMMQWGLHLSKHTIQMPGGGTTNGSEIYQNGLVREEKAMERLRMEGEWPGIVIG